MMRVANALNGHKIDVVGMFAVALLTVGIDYSFHFLETTPMEIPAYFVAIFTFAFVGAALIPRFGILIGAVAFSIFKVIYNAIAVLFNINGFTVLTQSGGIWFNGFAYAPNTMPCYGGAMCPAAYAYTSNISVLVTYGIAWFFLHAIFFIIAALIVIGATHKR